MEADNPVVPVPADPPNPNKELILAARRGKLALVKELLDGGADVNYRDVEFSMTALMHANERDHLDVVNELLARGADVTKLNRSGTTVLYQAAYRGHVDILKKIIEKYIAGGYHLNGVDSQGKTALHQAVEGVYVNSVRALVENGANTMIRDDDGLTPYDYAAGGRGAAREEIRALLLAHPNRELPAYVSAASAAAPANPAPGPEPIVFEVMKIQYKNQKVYDFEENEEVPILSLLSKSWSIIFKAKESYFTLPLDTIVKAVKDGSQVRHECKRQLDGAPYEKDVDMVRRYYYIQGNGNFIVWLHQLEQGLLQDFKIYDLEETEEELDNVASAQNVQKTPGVNRYGNPINIVSADHCQKGTKQKVFKLIPVVFTDEAQPPAPSSGQKRRRVEDDAGDRAADILRGMRAGARRRTWKRKVNGKGRKTRKSRK